MDNWKFCQAMILGIIPASVHLGITALYSSHTNVSLAVWIS